MKKLGIVILIILAFLGAEENYLLLLKRIIFLGVAIIFIVGPLLLLTLLVCEILPPKRIRLVNESVSVLRIPRAGRRPGPPLRRRILEIWLFFAHQGGGLENRHVTRY